MKVAIIGAGNMGGAVARGLASGTKVCTSDIVVANPTTPKLVALSAEYPEIKVTTNNKDAVKDADLIILAVKPWKAEEVINEIKPVLDYERQMIASMAGGVGLSQISAWLKREDDKLPPTYYLIPNTAIAVKSSMTFMAAARTTLQQDEEMQAIFRELGEVMMVEERLMGAGTALASCGIAYAMRYLRAATEGGVELGFYAQDAQKIVMQTMKGAVELLESNGSHPEEEIDRVTTPGGLTIRGLNAMEEGGFTNSVIQGLRASKK